jgi:hypothetical protein
MPSQVVGSTTCTIFRITMLPSRRPIVHRVEGRAEPRAPRPLGTALLGRPTADPLEFGVEDLGSSDHDRRLGDRQLGEGAQGTKPIAGLEIDDTVASH